MLTSIEQMEKLDNLFHSKTHQQEVLIEIYKMYIPNWDKIKQIHGWPKVGKKLSQYFWHQFMVFDNKHHPNVMAGGLWMNKGFSEDDSLGDYEVSIEGLNIEYEEE